VLLHPLAVGREPLLWQDWSRREHRRACIHLIRSQRVEIEVQRGVGQPPSLLTSRLPRSPAPSAPIPAFLGSSDWFAMPIPRRRDRSRSACLASRQGLPLLSVWQVGKFGCSSPGCCAPIELQRLLKPLVQERNGPLPGKASSLGVILGAILLEEPMLGYGKDSFLRQP